MSLCSDFLSELQAQIGQGGGRVTATQGRRTVRCDVDLCDPLGVALTELVLETSELATADIAKLESASQSLCQRVNYLLEPISPIETDADGCVVQMRSSPPQQHEQGRFYYELLLRRGGSVALYRYEKQPASARTRVAANLTHEVIGRLVDDFAATVDEVLTS